MKEKVCESEWMMLPWSWRQKEKYSFSRWRLNSHSTSECHVSSRRMFKTSQALQERKGKVIKSWEKETRRRLYLWRHPLCSSQHPVFSPAFSWKCQSCGRTTISIEVSIPQKKDSCHDNKKLVSKCLSRLSTISYDLPHKKVTPVFGSESSFE